MVPAKVEVEYFDNLLSSLGNSINGCAGADVSAVMVNNEILNDFVDDDCDHIVLKERRRRLLSRFHFVFNVKVPMPFPLGKLCRSLSSIYLLFLPLSFKFHSTQKHWNTYKKYLHIKLHIEDICVYVFA